MIDPHVHLRDWGQSSKETILHGMSIAAEAGFTHLFDMPNTSPACTDRDTILSRLADGGESAEKTGVSYHLYAGLTQDPEQVKEMAAVHDELFPLVIGLKMFAGNSTGGMGLTGIEQQRKVFTVLKEAGYRGILLVHCEKESLMHPECYVRDHFATWSLARPAVCESESVRDMIFLAEETGFEGGLHICHISTRAAIELVKQARGRGLNISCGATAHHSLLTARDALEHDRFLKMNPPVRDEANRQAVYQGLIDGDIDFVESDHAPHTLEDKLSGASGIPGFTASLVLLKKLRKDGVTESRLEDLFALKAAERFGIEACEPLLPSRIDWRIRHSRLEYPVRPF